MQTDTTIASRGLTRRLPMTKWGSTAWEKAQVMREMLLGIKNRAEEAS